MASRNIIEAYRSEILIGIAIAFFFQLVNFIGLVFSPMKRIITFGNVGIDILISGITLALLAGIALAVHKYY